VNRLEFFFDCSSPWTYLAFEGASQLGQQFEFELEWRPILVGGVFNEINPSVYEQRSRPVPAKARYQAKDLQDWAKRAGLRIGQPSVFPVSSDKAMRSALVALDTGALPIYAKSVFSAYWEELRDISDEDVLAECARCAGLDPAALREQREAPAIKARLRQNTGELIERGGFGSPTFFVNRSDMYFGNDRLVLVREALTRAAQRSD